MLHITKKIIALCIAVSAMFSSCVVALGHDISQWGIRNIVFPEGYYACNREDFDSKFLSYIRSKGYSKQEWIESVMIPGGMFVNARSINGNEFVVTVKEHGNLEDPNGYIKYHRLMYDYHLASVSTDRYDILLSYRNSLVDSGVQKKDIYRITWIDASRGLPTPYVMGSYFDGHSYKNEYMTVYNGRIIKITHTSSKRMDNEFDKAFLGTIYQIGYDYNVDYAQAKLIVRQNERLAFINENSAGSNAALTQSLSIIVLILIFIFSIFETTGKSRVQNRSRRISKTGKY